MEAVTDQAGVVDGFELPVSLDCSWHLNDAVVDVILVIWVDLVYHVLVLHLQIESHITVQNWYWILSVNTLYAITNLYDCEIDWMLIHLQPIAWAHCSLFLLRIPADSDPVTNLHQQQHYCTLWSNLLKLHSSNGSLQLGRRDEDGQTSCQLQCCTQHCHRNSQQLAVPLEVSPTALVHQLHASLGGNWRTTDSICCPPSSATPIMYTPSTSILVVEWQSESLSSQEIAVYLKQSLGRERHR